MESTSATSHNPWLTVSAALMGVIVGYGVGTVHLSWLNGGAVTAQVAQGTPDVPNVPDSLPPPPPAPAADPAPVTDADHVRGEKDALITVIEYSDFQCPFCSRVKPTLDQVLSEYDGQVNMVYRHFPLSFHPFAQKAAEGSECAAEIGGNDGFWKYHDKIFENQPSLSDAYILTAAKDIGLNEAKFKSCLDSGKYTKLVQDQMNEGGSAGVQGTPGSFVVNNETGEARSVSGAVPYENFKSVIDELLAKK